MSMGFWLDLGGPHKLCCPDMDFCTDFGSRLADRTSSAVLIETALAADATSDESKEGEAGVGESDSSKKHIRTLRESMLL